jgi:hypothetical protein
VVNFDQVGGEVTPWEFADDGENDQATVSALSCAMYLCVAVGDPGEEDLFVALTATTVPHATNKTAAAMPIGPRKKRNHFRWGLPMMLVHSGSGMNNEVIPVVWLSHAQARRTGSVRDALSTLRDGGIDGAVPPAMAQQQKVWTTPLR